MLNRREEFRGPAFNQDGQVGLTVNFTSTSLLKDVIEPDRGFKLDAFICPVSIHLGEARTVLV